MCMHDCSDPYAYAEVFIATNANAWWLVVVGHNLGAYIPGTVVPWVVLRSEDRNDRAPGQIKIWSKSKEKRRDGIYRIFAYDSCRYILHPTSPPSSIQIPPVRVHGGVFFDTHEATAPTSDLLLLLLLDGSIPSLVL